MEIVRAFPSPALRSFPSSTPRSFPSSAPRSFPSSAPRSFPSSAWECGARSSCFLSVQKQSFWLWVPKWNLGTRVKHLGATSSHVVGLQRPAQSVIDKRLVSLLAHLGLIRSYHCLVEYKGYALFVNVQLRQDGI